MGTEKLTKQQTELLRFMEQTAVVDITDERVAGPLVKRGLVLKYFEAFGPHLLPVWTITAAGRAALATLPREESRNE